MHTIHVLDDYQAGMLMLAKLVGVETTFDVLDRAKIQEGDRFEVLAKLAGGSDNRQFVPPR